VANIVKLQIEKIGQVYRANVTYADGSASQFTGATVEELYKRAAQFDGKDNIVASWWSQTESGLSWMRKVVTGAAALKMQWEAEVSTLVMKEESGVPIQGVGVTKNRILEVAGVHDAFQKFLDSEVTLAQGWVVKPRDVLMRVGDPYVKSEPVDQPPADEQPPVAEQPPA